MSGHSQESVVVWLHHCLSLAHSKAWHKGSQKPDVRARRSVSEHERARAVSCQGPWPHRSPLLEEVGCHRWPWRQAYGLGPRCSERWSCLGFQGVPSRGAACQTAGPSAACPIHNEMQTFLPLEVKIEPTTLAPRVLLWHFSTAFSNRWSYVVCTRVPSEMSVSENVAAYYCLQPSTGGLSSKPLLWANDNLQTSLCSVADIKTDRKLNLAIPQGESL